MQNPMFVFAGFKNDNSIDNLSVLIEEFYMSFSKQQLTLTFKRKDKLLTSRFEDVNFYISIFDNEEEVKDWYQMAKDFELTTKPNPIEKSSFEKRLVEKKLKLPGLYKEVHYLIAEIIYIKLNKLELQKIYFFF